MSYIIFNGQAYRDLADMPPEVRQAYEQAQLPAGVTETNGLDTFLSDIFQREIKARQAKRLKRAKRAKRSATRPVVVDGQTYASVNDVPLELREKHRQRINQAFGPMQLNRLAKVMSKEMLGLNDTTPHGPAVVAEPPSVAAACLTRLLILTLVGTFLFIGGVIVVLAVGSALHYW